MSAIQVSDEQLEKVMAALRVNGIDAVVVDSGVAAKEYVQSLIPKGAEVMTMTSVTLDQTGISDLINKSGEYKANREIMWSQEATLDEKKRAGNLADWTVGSVHAITEDGQVLIASNTGSQLPAYAYSSDHVVWVVGIQKIVKNLDEGMKRIYEYVLPLESERARKAYGVAGSYVSKLLVFNREPRLGRITVLFVKEVLGY